MPNTPLLSVAIVVQNQRDVLETTLTSLFELSHIPFELFLIDDASDDGSKNVIQSLLDYYQHEQTYYYQQPRPTGRANGLNEILPQCSSTLFWAPETLRNIDEQQLKKDLVQLFDSDRAALIEQGHLPEHFEQWTEVIQQGSWIRDGSFIWNLAALPAADLFFNPYISGYHGMELAVRVDESAFEASSSVWHQQHALEEPDVVHRQELLLTLLRKTTPSGSDRKSLIQELQALESPPQQTSEPEAYRHVLDRALSMKENGQFNAALEIVEQILQEEPDHQEARELKIGILEKKRRFVQASELKHETGKGTAPKSPQEASSKDKTSVSLIIPTTTYGKPALEGCLLSVSEHCDEQQLELIIIDNASLDDTHDYLDELKEKQFLDCKVITNQRNKGFAASVNQGLEKATGTYACVMHNDVEVNSDAIGRLAAILDAHPEYVLTGPLTGSTLNPYQNVRHAEDMDYPVTEADYIDSFCMMLRNEPDLRMDEAYELAYFEDVDLCFQATSLGHKVGIVPDVEVDHHFGTTTLEFDLDTESEQYWKNVRYFNDKWDIQVLTEQELKSLSTFDQLLALDELVNPLFPEEEIKEHYERLFTDELRTEILQTRHDPETLCKLVHLFMVMGEREIMRHFEDHLEEIELPPSLIYQLVRFYFNRNIYSRCIHYLDQLQPQHDTLRADLYRLAIHIENKEFSQAIPMLKELLNHAPANPLLYKLSGDIHKFKGNGEEAASFYTLAEQINPFDFANQEKDTFGFEL